MCEIQVYKLTAPERLAKHIGLSPPGLGETRLTRDNYLCSQVGGGGDPKTVPVGKRMGGSAWVVAAELALTSQLFARTAAKIDPTWLEEAGADLCRRHYGDPHWEEKSAQVMAKEQVSLYGLPIVRDRKVHYGPKDPGASRDIFITHALVRQEYKTKGRFMEHNQKLFEQVHRLRDKARRSDLRHRCCIRNRWHPQARLNLVGTKKPHDIWGAIANNCYSSFCRCPHN